MLCNYLVEEYYERIKPEVNLIGSFTGDKELVDVIIKCRLKPYRYNTQFNRKLILRKHWVDEFGNSLILKGKQIKIIENHLELEPGEIKNSDLYYGLPIDKISKISTLMHLSIGEDEDFRESCVVLTFLGVDSCLRTFCLYNGEIERYSPLSLGIDNLKNILKNKDIKLFNKLNNKDTVIYPCHKKDEWVVSLPIHPLFWKEKNMNKELLNQLGVV